MTFGFYLSVFSAIFLTFMLILTILLIARYNRNVLRKSYLDLRLYIYVMFISAIFFGLTILYAQYQSININIAALIYASIYLSFSLTVLIVLIISLRELKNIQFVAKELALGKKNLNVEFEGALEFESLAKSLEGVQSVYKENDKKLSKKDNEYQKFIPKQYLKYFGVSNIVDLNVGDFVQTKLAVMFCDLRNSYFSSETLSLTDNFLLIKEFMSYVSSSVKNCDGFIDKYLGDGVIAIFDDVKNAFDCANKIAKGLDYKNIVSIGKEPINFGISLNVGNCVVGIVGEKKQKQFSVVSDVVNLCSRIESLNKLFGTRVLMTKAFMSELENDASFRYVGTINFDDLTSTIPLFESLDAYSNSKKLLMTKTLQDFESGVRYYEKNDFNKAKQYFANCIKTDKTDLLCKFYLTKSLETSPKNLPLLE